MADSLQLGRQLDSGPSDGITSLHFLDDSTRLVASSWDGVSPLEDIMFTFPQFDKSSGSATMSKMICIMLEHLCRSQDFCWYSKVPHPGQESFIV